jgi:hypothetical protein
MDNINDIECREPREVFSTPGTVVPSVTPNEDREFKMILISFGLGAVVVIVGVVIYIAVE